MIKKCAFILLIFALLLCAVACGSGADRAVPVPGSATEKVTPQVVTKPADFGSWAEATISWAEARVGSYEWYDEEEKQGYCLRFVANAFRQQGPEPEGDWNSAWEASRELELRHEQPRLAPRGALIFFESTKDNPFGHVGIHLGDEKIIHTYGKVRIDTIKDVPNLDSGTLIGPYMGWAYPPEKWRPQTPARQPVTVAQSTEDLLRELVKAYCDAWMEGDYQKVMGCLSKEARESFKEDFSSESEFKTDVYRQRRNDWVDHVEIYFDLIEDEDASGDIIVHYIEGSQYGTRERKPILLIKEEGEWRMTFYSPPWSRSTVRVKTFCVLFERGGEDPFSLKQYSLINIKSTSDWPLTNIRVVVKWYDHGSFVGKSVRHYDWALTPGEERSLKIYATEYTGVWLGACDVEVDHMAPISPGQRLVYPETAEEVFTAFFTLLMECRYVDAQKYVYVSDEKLRELKEEGYDTLADFLRLTSEDFSSKAERVEILEVKPVDPESWLGKELSEFQAAVDIKSKIYLKDGTSDEGWTAVVKVEGLWKIPIMT